MKRLYNNYGSLTENGYLERKIIQTINIEYVKRVIKEYPLAEINSLMMNEINYQISIELLRYSMLKMKTKRILRGQGINRMLANSLPYEILIKFKNMGAKSAQYIYGE